MVFFKRVMICTKMIISRRKKNQTKNSGFYPVFLAVSSLQQSSPRGTFTRRISGLARNARATEYSIARERIHMAASGATDSGSGAADDRTGDRVPAQTPIKLKNANSDRFLVPTVKTSRFFHAGVRDLCTGFPKLPCVCHSSSPWIVDCGGGEFFSFLGLCFLHRITVWTVSKSPRSLFLTVLVCRARQRSFSFFVFF
jgi:hypothetical protein